MASVDSAAARRRQRRLDVIPLRTLVPEPQIAEQLVEVLTPFRIFEQNVDIPGSQVGVARGGLQGFLSGQGSVGEQNLDIPASGRGVFWQSHRFSPKTEYGAADCGADR